MPKLLKILSRSKKKADDSTSVASGTSNASKRSSRSLRSSKSKQSQSFVEDTRTGLQICGYIVEKESNLPKLHKHAWKGNLTKVKANLKKGGDVAKHGVDNKGRNALHLAAAMGHTDVASYLVSEGVKIEGRDAQMRTPLLKSADSGHLECLKMLLDNGADPNASDATGLTAIHVSVHRRELEVVRELIGSGAQLDMANNNGSYPVHLAALQGNGDMVQLLAKKGTDLNGTDNEGKTPLILAAQNGHTRAVKILLEMNAAPNMKAQGMTALEYATKNGHQECAKVLQDHKRKQSPFSIGGLAQNSNLTGSFGYGGIPYESAVYGQKSDEESESQASVPRKDKEEWSSSADEDSIMHNTGGKINLSGVLKRPTSSESTHEAESDKGKLPSLLRKPPLPQTSHKEGTEEKVEFPSDQVQLPTSRVPVTSVKDQLEIDFHSDFESSSEDEKDGAFVGGKRPSLAHQSPTSTVKPGLGFGNPPPTPNPPPLRPITPSISTPQHTIHKSTKDNHIESDFDSDTEEEVLPGDREVSSPPKEQDKFGRSLLAGAGVVDRKETNTPATLLAKSTGPTSSANKPGEIGGRETLKEDQLPVGTGSGENTGRKLHDDSDFDSTEDEEDDVLPGAQAASRYFQQDSEGSGGKEAGGVLTQPPSAAVKKQDLVSELFGSLNNPEGERNSDSNFDSESDLDLPDGSQGYVPSMLQVRSEPKRGGPSAVQPTKRNQVHQSQSFSEPQLSPPSNPLSPTSPPTVTVTPLTTAPITPLTMAPITPLTTAPITPHTTAPITPLTTAPNITPFTGKGLLEESSTERKPKGQVEASPVGSFVVTEPPTGDQEEVGQEDSGDDSEWDSGSDEDQLGGALAGLDGTDIISSFLPKQKVTPSNTKRPSNPVPKKVDYFSMMQSDDEDSKGEGVGSKRTVVSEVPGRELRVRQIIDGLTSPTPTSPPQDGNGDQDVKKSGSQNAIGNENQKVSDSWDSIEEEEEEEEESEWEIEKRNSKQLMQQSLSDSKDVVSTSPPSFTLSNLLSGLPKEHHKSPLPPVQQRVSPSPLEPLHQSPLQQRISPSPLEPLHQSPPQREGSPSPMDPLHHKPQSCVSSLESPPLASELMQPSGETHLAEDSPNTAREKMEKESAQRYRSRETELLNILQKRKNRIEESDSHFVSSKEHIQPNKSSLNERSPEGDGSRKSSRGNNPSVADIRSPSPSKMAGEQQDVSMHPPSRGSQSASSVQPSASKVRGIIMNSLSAPTDNQGPLAIEHHEPKHPLPLTSTHTTSLPEQPPVKQLAQVDTPPSEVSSSSKSLNPPPNPVDPPPKLVDQPPRSPPKLVDPPPRSPPKPVDPPPKHVDTPPIQLSLDSTHHMDCTPVHSTHTDTSVVLPRASEDISSTRELSDTEVSEGEGASVQSPPPVVEDTKKRVTLEENEQSFRKDSQRFPTVSSKMSTSMQYVIQTAVSGQSSSDPSNDDFSESESISLGDHGTEGVDADDGNEQVVGGPTTTDIPSRPHSQISLRGIQMSPMAMQETSQLREALRDTRRKLETVETAKNDLESQRKNAEEELCRVKIANRRLTAEKSELERLKNDLELETRVLKHKLEVETEDKKSLDMTIVELRAKINSVEEEMSSERQSKYSLELRKKELEMKQQTLERTNQQLQLKLAELMEEARTEKEGRRTADQKFSASAKDLLQIQEKLQVALDEKHKVMSQLENSEVSRQKLADRVALQKEENREIQAQLLKDKKQYDEALDSLERELETANNKLSEKTDLLAVTENNSLDLRRQYEVNLNEVRTKSEMLGAACDREAANRQKLEQEVTGLMTKLEYSHAQLEELTRRNIDLERSGHSSKTDWIYEKSKYEKELEMSKERVETLCARIESLEQNLSSSDAEVKSLQAVSAEKSHTITVLERDLEQRAASLTVAEEKIDSLNECVNTTVSSLQSEFSRSKKELEKKLIELREQLGERELEMRELTRERDDLSLKMEGIDKMGGADSIRAHIDSLVDTEKKKQRKMDTLQRQTEAKIEQERQRCAGLQREVASLKGKLKTNKAKLKESEGRLTGVVAMREDYERIQSSMQSDLHAMKEKVAKYEAQLIEGSALRMEAEMQNKALQKEAHHLNKKLTAIAASKTEKEREIQKLERHNRKLTDELHSYKDHVASNYVEKNEALALKQHIEDKAHNELKKKLQEVNEHLEQQALNQQDMDRMRQASEAEWKDRYTQDTTLLKTQISKLQSSLEDSKLENDQHTAEARKFRALYESELAKTQRLTSRLERAKENAAASRTKLLLERNRERLLADTTLSNATKLDHSQLASTVSHITNPSPVTGRDRDSTTTKREDDALLASVRRELDSSLARHLDPGLTPISSWKSGQHVDQSFLKPSDLSKRTSTDPHLQSIVRGYRLN